MSPSEPYRLLYFRANQLERWETIPASSDLDAVQEAARRPSDDVAELWAFDRKIAVFRPFGTAARR